MGESWNLDWFFVEDWLHAIVQLCVDEYDARMSLMSIDETGCQICRVARPCPEQFPSRMMRMKQFLREATTKTPLCFWRGKPNQLKN